MQAPKLTDLIIEETSGVDHPAHLHEGWLVVKADHVQDAADVLNALPDPTGGSMADESTDTPATEDEVVVEESTEETPDTSEDARAVANARIAELEGLLAEK
jgi:hypothetical protein